MGFLKPFLPLSSAAVFDRCMEDDLFDQFLMEQLIYIYRNSDLDVFQLGATEQINQIICALNVICERCAVPESANLPEHIEHVIINLVHFSMSLWFSLEWQVCDLLKRCHLLQTLFRLERFFSKVSHLKSINWFYLKDLGVQPWSNPYFKRHLVKDPIIDPTIAAAAAGVPVRSEEDIQEQANEDDITILRQEGLVISLLRLIKMFDAGGIESVKSFSIRVLSAWNQLQQRDGFLDVHPEAKRCLNMISHIYMMSVYEKDNSTGYDIDNMINDVRIYHKTIIDSEQNGKILDDKFHNIIKTPAALIALTSVKMKQSFQDMAESGITDLVRETSSTRFGAVSHSYITYLLANILVDFNRQDVEDFDANIDTYKRLLHVYVSEREKSERFALEESRKRKLLNTSCNITTNIKDIYNYKAAIGKGNRRSNLISEKSNNAYLFDIENEKRYDPVFQTMPYNRTITNEFYKLLSQSNYKGWHYARLVLLLKLVDCELKEFNSWCYHPGLSTDFMLNLESILAQRFVDLARIFESHIFMEQEFWLTAFYFRPDEHLYNKVMSCGARYQRTLNYLNRGCLNEMVVKNSEGDADEENNCAFMNAKYGLLSSTYDVKQIANMTGKDSAQNDYADLSKALRTLRLPENIIKDILTVTFSGRHANYTWAAEWSTLRKRCKALHQTPELKRKLVESNMAEANDRLKYLKIDYQKYQNLPQLDYGSIEEGYEDAYTIEGRKDDEDDDDMDDDDDSEDENEKDKIDKRKAVVGRQTKNSTKDLVISTSESESIDETEMESIKEPEIIDNGNPNKRSSARRAAAVIASAMLREDFHLKASPKKKDETKKPVAELETFETSPPHDNEQNNDNQMEISMPIMNLSASSAAPAAAPAAATITKMICNKFVNISDYWLENTNEVTAESVFKYKTKFPKLDALKRAAKIVPQKAADINKIADEAEFENGQDNIAAYAKQSSDINKFLPLSVYDEPQQMEETRNHAVSQPAKPSIIAASKCDMSTELWEDAPLATLKELNTRPSDRLVKSKNSNVEILNVTVIEATPVCRRPISPTPPQLPSVISSHMTATTTNTVTTAVIESSEKSPNQMSAITSLSTAAMEPLTTPATITPAPLTPVTTSIANRPSATLPISTATLTKLPAVTPKTTPASSQTLATTPTIEMPPKSTTPPTKPSTVTTTVIPVRNETPPMTALATTTTSTTVSTANQPLSAPSLELPSATSTTASNVADFTDYDDIINSSVVMIEPKNMAIVNTQDVTPPVKKVVKRLGRPPKSVAAATTPTPTATVTTTSAIQSTNLSEPKIKVDLDPTETNTTTLAKVPTTIKSMPPANAQQESAAAPIVKTAETTETPAQTLTTQLNIADDSVRSEPTELLETASALQLDVDDESSSIQSSSSNCMEPKISAEEKKKITQKLIESRFKRNCYVKIKRTCMKSYERQQRLPTVRLKRINMQKYFEESSRSRSASNSKSFDSEDNSSSPAPVITKTRRNCLKKRQSSTTPEESASLSSDEEYIPQKTKKRSTPLSSLSSVSSSPASTTSSTHKNKNEKASTSISLFKSLQQRRNSARNFSVVPRSASGMKVCISSSTTLRDVAPPNECIEILSSDDEEDENLGLGKAVSGAGVNDEQDPLPTCPLQFANVSMPLADFAEFEVEEI